MMTPRNNTVMWQMQAGTTKRLATNAMLLPNCTNMMVQASTMPNGNPRDASAWPKSVRSAGCMSPWTLCTDNIQATVIRTFSTPREELPGGAMNQYRSNIVKVFFI